MDRSRVAAQLGRAGAGAAGSHTSTRPSSHPPVTTCPPGSTATAVYRAVVAAQLTGQGPASPPRCPPGNQARAGPGLQTAADILGEVVLRRARLLASTAAARCSRAGQRAAVAAGCSAWPVTAARTAATVVLAGFAAAAWRRSARTGQRPRTRSPPRSSRCHRPARPAAEGHGPGSKGRCPAGTAACLRFRRPGWASRHPATARPSGESGAGTPGHCRSWRRLGVLEQRGVGELVAFSTGRADTLQAAGCAVLNQPAHVPGIGSGRRAPWPSDRSATRSLSDSGPRRRSGAREHPPPDPRRHRCVRSSSSFVASSASFWAPWNGLSGPSASPPSAGARPACHRAGQDAGGWPPARARGRRPGPAAGWPRSATRAGEGPRPARQRPAAGAARSARPGRRPAATARGTGPRSRPAGLRSHR